jgi:NhaP-type Na+/H+ or K+/H+ antiporter
VGLAILGAMALRSSTQRGWIAEPWVGLPVVALAFASFTLTQFAGGSGFIACFIGGLVFGALAKEHKHAVLEGAEGTGEAFAMMTWIAFGAAVVFDHPGTVDWRVVVYALLSLTVVRMLPVFLCVSGLGVRTDAKLFLGWFGPRGLASIVFGVIVLGEHLPSGDTIVATTVVTVALSVVGHGLTANPLAAAFGARAKSETRDA